MKKKKIKAEAGHPLIFKQKRNRQIMVFLIVFCSLNLLLGGLTYHSSDSSTNHFCFMLSATILAAAIMPFLDRRRKSNRLGAVIFCGMMYGLVIAMLFRWIPTFWWFGLAGVEIVLCSGVSYYYQKNGCELRQTLSYLFSIGTKTEKSAELQA